MVDIKITDEYMLKVTDGKNLSLYRWTDEMVDKVVNGKVVKEPVYDISGKPVMAKGKQRKRNVKVPSGEKVLTLVGHYGTNFHSLVKGMIDNKIVGSNCNTVLALDAHIRHFISEINFDDVVKQLHKEIVRLKEDEKVTTTRVLRKSNEKLRKENKKLKEKLEQLKTEDVETEEVDI